MARQLENLSFDRIRPWRGSLDRAFEELSFQLLKDEVPRGSHAIRTGNPDGGVEWYAELATGEQWGWQAKNVRDIDALLSGMTTSVKQVVAERPELVRLTFVISRNLNTGTAKGKWKSERQKYEDKVESWKQSIIGADHIEFHLVQESDLLDRLALPQHQGRLWFWWDQARFGNEWLESLYEQQRIAAGEKYRPDLQVDLPISDDLRGLGLSQSFVEEFRQLCKRILKDIDRLRKIDCEEEELATAWQAVLEATRQVAAELTLGHPFSQLVVRFESLERSTKSCKEVSEQFQQRAMDLRESLREPVDKGANNRGRSLDYLIHEARSLRSELAELLHWLSQPAAHAARKKLYFLTGPAGSGKTHLFLDSLRAALDENRPAVVLFGGRFGMADIWASICDQLGLPPLGRDVLLGAMESAALAASIDDTRFVIMIDALNETVSPRFWEFHLPELRSAVSVYPHVALAVSCRDTYLDVIDPNSERSEFATRTHPGFGGREVEATQKYFEHYGLEAPRIPLLVPEFTVPLFLRLYCESLRDGGKSVAAVGHEGRVGIFEQYLDAKIALVARKVFPSAVSNFEIGRHQERVKAVLDALLDGIASAGAEWLSVKEAEARVASVLEGDTISASRAIGAFESEGILSREPLYLVRQEKGAGVRFSFQAFSDFLLLRRRLEGRATPQEDEDLRDWLLNTASWGIIEAAAVLMPEKYGLELPDFLCLRRDDLDPRNVRSRATHQSASRARHIYRLFAETLPYRTASSIDQRTIDLLNDALQTVLHLEDFYRIVFMTAPQPENPLNGEGLHRYLVKTRMPKRDASFGFAVYDEFWEESSPLARLARWAAHGPYPAYSPQVIELAAIPLLWLLSSPNRFMRDWVTKALVQLLHGHLEVMRALFQRFWNVDDPYVVQRVVVIAYGCLMRGGTQDTKQAGLVARAVLDHAFERPIRPDALMLDAAQGIVEWGVVHAVLPANALDAIKRPYGLKRPGNPPPFAKLKERYDPDERLPADESYSTVFSSFFGIGDFGRYVVDPRVGRFSRFLYGRQVPKPKKQGPRFVKSRWTELVRALTDAQAEAVRKTMESESVSEFLAVARLRNGPPDLTLTPQQLALLDSVYRSPHSRMDYAYSRNRARRWVFRRTLTLGWTPNLFGVRDQIIDHSIADRDDHKAERWGKKYQWMALHELLARIADNFQPLREYDDEEPFDRLPLIASLRDIDPSLPPVSYRELIENQDDEVPTWLPPPIARPQTLAPRIEFHRFRGDVKSFLQDRETMPCLPETATFTDDGGTEWLALKGFEIQREVGDVWDGGALEQATWLWSALVDSNSAPSSAEILKGLWRKTFDGLDAQGHLNCCYAGEVGWTPRSCLHQLGGPRTIEDRGSSILVLDTCEVYIWSTSLDCSISGPVRGTFPSTFVQKNSNLRMTMSGPSWLNEHGELVGFDREFGLNRSTALFMRLDWLRAFLQEKELSLVILLRVDRLLLDPPGVENHPRLNVWTSAVINEDGPLALVGEPTLLDEMW